MQLGAPYRYSTSPSHQWVLSGAFCPGCNQNTASRKGKVKSEAGRRGGCGLDAGTALDLTSVMTGTKKRPLAFLLSLEDVF